MTRRTLSQLGVQTLLLLSFSVISSVSETPVTCAAPLSALGQPSHLTCFFQRDLHASNKQFMVVRHSFGASNDDHGKDVLTCTRRVHSDALRCEAKEGYLFDGEISDRLTLRIPSVTNDTAGQYWCHVIPPDDCVAYPCSLAVNENHVMNVHTTTIPPSGTKPRQNGMSEITSITFVCIAVFATALVFVLYLCHRNPRWHLWMCRRDNNEDADQTSQSEDRVESIPFNQSINPLRQNV